MAEAIDVNDLARGDVFRVPGYSGTARDQLRQVIEIRTQNTMTTYRVITYRNLATDRNGVLDMRVGMRVQRLRQVSTDEALLLASGVAPGEHLTLWRRVDGGFYA